MASILAIRACIAADRGTMFLLGIARRVMDNEKDEFVRLCGICVLETKSSGHKTYVRRANIGDHFVVSGYGGVGWLFVAYPGGRKKFSVAGKKIAGL
jgi:hypothetical protein